MNSFPWHSAFLGHSVHKNLDFLQKVENLAAEIAMIVHATAQKVRASAIAYRASWDCRRRLLAAGDGVGVREGVAERELMCLFATWYVKCVEKVIFYV